MPPCRVPRRVPRSRPRRVPVLDGRSRRVSPFSVGKHREADPHFYREAVPDVKVSVDAPSSPCPMTPMTVNDDVCQVFHVPFVSAAFVRVREDEDCHRVASCRATTRSSPMP